MMEKKTDIKISKTLDNRLEELQQSLDMNYGAYSRLLFAIQQCQETTALKHQSLNAKIDELEKKIETLHTSLIEKISDRFSLLEDGFANVQKMLNQLSSSQEQMEPLPELVRNIDYNIRVSGSGNSDKEYVADLQKRLSEFQEDTYLKLLRKYILDSFISLYTNISYQIFEKGLTTQMQNILKIIENDLLKMGIKLRSSNTMQRFDPLHMTICDGKTDITDDEKSENLVSRSIVPEFIWTLPAIGHQQVTTLQKEVVILYTLKR